MSQDTTNRIVSYDKLRIIAAFLIIMVHVSAQYWNEVPITSSQWMFMNVYDILGIAGVPIFFMLSGALMLNPNKITSFKKLYLRILQFVVIYIFWLAIYNLLPLIFNEKNYSDYSIKDILYNVLTGAGAYHLWFLPELIILYIVSPILKMIFKSKKICEYYLGIYFITGIILPSVLLFNFPYKIFVESLYSRTSLPLLTGYVGYFILGHYLTSYFEIKKTKNNFCILLLTFIVANVVASSIDYYDALKTGCASTLINTPLGLPQFASSISIFIFVKTFLNSSGSISYQSKLADISSLTLGVYLLHPLIIKIMMLLGMDTTFPHASIMIPIYTFIIFIITILLVFIIQKIPLLHFLVKP